MGYYSEVGLILKKSAVEKLHQKLKQSDLDSKTRDYVECTLKYVDKHEKDNEQNEMWYWDGIKWYEDEPEYFPEVKFLTDFMNEIDTQAYRFIRIGEDDMDIEQRGSYYDNSFDMWLERRISFR